MKKVRKSKSVYVRDDELEVVNLFAKRIGMTTSKAIRSAALIMAANPDLDYLFDEGVLLNVSPEIIKRGLMIINKTEAILAMPDHRELIIKILNIV